MGGGVEKHLSGNRPADTKVGTTCKSPLVKEREGERERERDRATDGALPQIVKIAPGEKLPTPRNQRSTRNIALCRGSGPARPGLVWCFAQIVKIAHGFKNCQRPETNNQPATPRFGADAARHARVWFDALPQIVKIAPGKNANAPKPTINPQPHFDAGANIPCGGLGPWFSAC